MKKIVFRTEEFWISYFNGNMDLEFGQNKMHRTYCGLRRSACKVSVALMLLDFTNLCVGETYPSIDKEELAL